MALKGEVMVGMLLVEIIKAPDRESSMTGDV